MRDELAAQLGEPGFRRLDEDWQRFIKTLPKTVDTEVFPPMDGRCTRGEANFRPPSPLVLRLDKTSKSKFVVTAQPLLAQAGQGDFVFERSRGRWVRVTLLGNQGSGSVHVTERQMKNHLPVGWKLLAQSTSDLAGIRVGRTADLRIEVRGRQMKILIAGSMVVETKLPGTLAGRYGVGGPFGNHVAWHKVRLR